MPKLKGFFPSFFKEENMFSARLEPGWGPAENEIHASPGFFKVGNFQTKSWSRLQKEGHRREY